MKHGYKHTLHNTNPGSNCSRIRLTGPAQQQISSTGGHNARRLQRRYVHFYWHRPHNETVQITVQKSKKLKIETCTKRIELFNNSKSYDTRLKPWSLRCRRKESFYWPLQVTYWPRHNLYWETRLLHCAAKVELANKRHQQARLDTPSSGRWLNIRQKLPKYTECKQDLTDTVSNNCHQHRHACHGRKQQRSIVMNPKIGMARLSHELLFSFNLQLSETLRLTGITNHCDRSRQVCKSHLWYGTKHSSCWYYLPV